MRSTPGAYPDVDFCESPEQVCLTNDEDRMWTVAMFEWAERIQRYSSTKGKRGFNYAEELVKFVEGGMNTFAHYYSDEVNTDRDNRFIHAVSSIVDRGCHDAPHCHDSGGPVSKLPQRRIAFTVALSALNIPTMRTELVVEQALDHFESRRDQIEESLLLYKTTEGFFRSRRYRFDDFMDALYRFSRPYAASDISYSPNITYFSSPDHPPLYMGDPYKRQGQKYGVANVALFLSNGMELSIEKDETCDELNEHPVSGKLPISNAVCSTPLIFYCVIKNPIDRLLCATLLNDSAARGACRTRTWRARTIPAWPVRWIRKCA